MIKNFFRQTIIILFFCLVTLSPGKVYSNEKVPEDSLRNQPPDFSDSLPQVKKDSSVIYPKLDKALLPGKGDKNYFFEDTQSPLLNKTFNYLDIAHNWLGGQINDLGEELDSFFSTEEDFDRTKGSRLDIKTPIRFHANGEVATDLQFRAKIELPRLNKRWNLIVSSVDESLNGFAGQQDNLSAGGQTPQGTAASGSTSTQNGTAVGLRYMLSVKDYTTSLVGFGLNFKGIDPDPYARIKGTYKWQLSQRWRTRMIQDLFWERVDGVGLNSNVKFDYQLNDLYLLRSETDGTWWDKDQDYELHHNFIYFQKVNLHRALAYHIGWDWDTQPPGFHLTSYHLGFNWRELIYKKWLYFEIEPRVDFHEDDQFRQADLSVIFMLEAQFFRQRNSL